MNAKQKTTAGKILKEMHETYLSRQKVYGNNYAIVGQIMPMLFPNGLMLKSPEDFEMFHLFDLLIGKLTRFTVSEMTHQDSIHDLAVYGAMVEEVLINSRRNK